MTIDNLKDLKQVIKALREGGVTSAEIDGVKLTLLPKPVSNARLTKIDFSADFPEANIPVPKYIPMNPDAPLEADKVETEELTDEQLLFYSAIGHDNQLSEQ